MVVLTAEDLLVSGVMVKADHPWAKGQMRRIAQMLGKNIPKNAIIIRTPPPWSKHRDYLDAMSENQLQAIVWFAEKNIELAEKYKNEPKYVRLYKRLRELEEYKGKVSFGRKTMPKRVGYEQAKRKLEMIKKGMPTPVTAEGIEMIEL